MPYQLLPSCGFCKSILKMEGIQLHDKGLFQFQFTPKLEKISLIHIYILYFIYYITLVILVSYDVLYVLFTSLAHV